MAGRVELPLVTPPDVSAKHISHLLVADLLRQVDQNLAEQQTNIQKLGEQVSNLQNLRVGSLAQKSLLTQLQAKLIEVDSANDAIAN